MRPQWTPGWGALLLGMIKIIHLSSHFRKELARVPCTVQLVCRWIQFTSQAIQPINTASTNFCKKLLNHSTYLVINQYLTSQTVIVMSGLKVKEGKMNKWRWKIKAKKMISRTFCMTITAVIPVLKLRLTWSSTSILFRCHLIPANLTQSKLCGHI